MHKVIHLEQKKIINHFKNKIMVMEYIKLEDATPAQVAAIKSRIELANRTLTELIPFHPSEILLVGDVCEVALVGTEIPIFVSRTLRGWRFYMPNQYNLKYVNNYDRIAIHIKRNNIGVLSTKKIKAEIEAVTKQYEELKSLSEQRVHEVSEHLAKVKVAFNLLLNERLLLPKYNLIRFIWLCI